MIQWVTCDRVTGAVMASLPGLRLESSLPNYVGRGDQINVSLPVANRPTDWQSATEAARAILVAHYDDPAQTILWAGPVMFRGYGSGPLIKMNAVSADGWLARRQVGSALGDYSVTDRDSCLVLADFLQPAADAFHGRVDVVESGITTTVAIADSDDKTLAVAAQTLMGLSNGPEYRIGWEWDAAGCLVMVATVAQRIGSSAPAVLLSGLEWSKSEDYGDGKGATVVTATATNSGAIRNQATRTATALIAAGYLPIDYRWTPDSAATDITDLGSYSDAKLTEIQQGTASVQLTFHPDGPYLINRDLQVGDTFEADLENPDMPEVNCSITARMLGFVAEADRVSGEIVTITPVIQEAS